MGEVLAAPSASELEAFACCLLDVQPGPQADRLARRGDPAELLVHHQAFAAWMRGHAVDPQHLPEVITSGAWPEMRWERWQSWSAGDPRWGCTVIDTSDRDPDEVALHLHDWCCGAISRLSDLTIWQENGGPTATADSGLRTPAPNQSGVSWSEPFSAVQGIFGASPSQALRAESLCT